MNAAKRAILARRARFALSTLAGTALGCAPPPSPVDPVPKVRIDAQPPAASSALAPGPAREPPPPPPADRDVDGVPDPLDACPDVPGRAQTDPERSGCPAAPCLSIVVPSKIEIHTQVMFPPADARVPAPAEPLLDEIAALLKNFPDMTLALRGHTDATESPAIARARADAVRAALVKRGVAGTRIASEGAGATMPLAPNATAEGRARNRRVEFVRTDASTP